jgi:glycosyltransferase involved in cell wall biosynthesis
MNLIFFTPACKISAIGRMAALVTRETVNLGHRVTVVRTESRHFFTTSEHDFGARIISWEDKAEVMAHCRSADAVIYHIGDNYEFHQGCVYWLSEIPGLVCLHDFFLGHLFYAWAQANREQAERILKRWYGEKIAGRFFNFSDSESFIEYTRDNMPMTEWICSQADGVITHSRWGCDRVMNSCSGPVKVVPLAYDAPALISDPLADKHTDNGNKPLQILTIGHVNPNKRVSSVINAIGSSRILRNNVVYRLVGAVQQETINALTDLAKGLDVQLIISGEVDDSELQNAIHASDIISCLRWPALEAASASAIESMLYGKAIIVTDTGYYKDIPDTCAVKVNHANEINEIRTVLEKFIKDKKSIRDIGTEAQRWATETYTSEKYAAKIIEILQLMARTIPKKRAISYFFMTLRNWSQSEIKLPYDESINSLNIFFEENDYGMLHKTFQSHTNNEQYGIQMESLPVNDNIYKQIEKYHENQVSQEIVLSDQLQRVRNQEALIHVLSAQLQEVNKRAQRLHMRVQRLEYKIAKGPLHLKQLLRHPKAFAREVLGLKFIK